MLFLVFFFFISSLVLLVRAGYLCINGVGIRCDHRGGLIAHAHGHGVYLFCWTTYIAWCFAVGGTEGFLYVCIG